jgi:hypothetical protein
MVVSVPNEIFKGDRFTRNNLERVEWIHGRAEKWENPCVYRKHQGPHPSLKFQNRLLQYC